MRTPFTSSIRSAIVTRRHGGARSVCLPSTVIVVAPVAAVAASEQIASTRSIMSW